MSERPHESSWNFYPCSKGSSLAWVAFDEQAEERLDTLPSTLVQIRATLPHPGPNGLATQEDADLISRLDDLFEAFAQERGGRYVGRITADGAQHMIAYCETDEAELSNWLEDLADDLDLELAYIVEPDPRRQAYDTQLRPSEDEWQMMRDMKVLHVLLENGDPLRDEREVTHYAYFPSRPAAEAFAERADGMGIAIEIEGPNEDGSLLALGTHAIVPTLYKIATFTVPLHHFALECGGEYDGWETQVCRASDTDES